MPLMPVNSSEVRLVIDALDEPTIIVRGRRIELANAAARTLLGPAIEGRDVRLAIRHPEALDLILARRDGDIDVAGIGELGRTWRLHIKERGRISAGPDDGPVGGDVRRKGCGSISSPMRATNCARR